MNWKSCPTIPPRTGMSSQFGLAGPVSGADGNMVMVAGGANFENGMPWRGGTKTYHDEIYLLEEKSDGSLSWEECGHRLPFPMAYSACVTLGNGFVSIGGENERGLLRSVFRYLFANGTVRIYSLPDLPVELTSLGATLIDQTIFVVGGLDKAGATSGCYTLSLENPHAGWSWLPDLPVRLSHAVVVSQFDRQEKVIYVIGGRNKTTKLSTFLSSVWKYVPSVQKWVKESDITINGQLVPLSAGTGFAVGKDLIVLFGGDRGLLYNQTEKMDLEIDAETDAARKDSLLKRKDYFLTHHSGFSGAILFYNTITRKWSSVGEIPGESPATTVAFQWKDKIMIPSGETRPGVRTDKVLMLEIK